MLLGPEGTGPRRPWPPLCGVGVVGTACFALVAVPSRSVLWGGGGGCRCVA